MFNCFAWQSSREDGERRRFERLLVDAISEFKTWWRQNLSRFLSEPNKSFQLVRTGLNPQNIAKVLVP